MSKNTNVSGFRKINIDAFDPENYQDDEPSNQQADEGGPNEGEIVNLLNKYGGTGQLPIQGQVKNPTLFYVLYFSSKKNTDALNAVLKNPPLNSKDQRLKDSTFQLVMRVLRSIQSSNDIDNAVKSLSDDAIDVLMKYVYKGFEKEPKDSSILLTWHEKVYARGGNGCIVRVLSDGRRI